MAEVAGAEHGAHVVRPEGDVTELDVLEVWGVAADLVDDAVCHVVLQVAGLVARGFDGRTATSHNSTTPTPVGPRGVGEPLITGLMLALTDVALTQDVQMA